MLDPWIIEEIRRREEEQRRQDQQKPFVIELPVHDQPAPGAQNRPAEGDADAEKPQRGIHIIDFSL